MVLKGGMDCSTCRHRLAAPSSLGSPFSLSAGLGLALKGWLVPSLSVPCLSCLGWRGFGWRGLWVLAGRGSVPWRTLQNTCFYVLRKRPGIRYIYRAVGNDPNAKHTHK